MIIFIIGMFIVGSLAVLSSVIPSRTEVEFTPNATVVAGEAIQPADSDMINTSQQNTGATHYIDAYAFISFLNTYYLHWLFLSGCILMAYGICSVLSYFRIKRKIK